MAFAKLQKTICDTSGDLLQAYTPVYLWRLGFLASVLSLFSHGKDSSMTAFIQHCFTVHHFCAAMIVNADTSEGPEPGAVALMKWSFQVMLHIILW